MSPAWIHHACPRCGDSFVIALGAPDPIRCGRCGLEHPGSSSALDPREPLVRCAVCAGREFYRQKDFNRSLGLAIVAVTAAVGFLVMVFGGRDGYLWGLSILGAVSLLDVLIYRRLPEVAVCYLCQSVYHGFAAGPRRDATHGSGGEVFYQGNEERFKALRNEWLARCLEIPAASAPSAGRGRSEPHGAALSSPAEEVGR